MPWQAWFWITYALIGLAIGYFTKWWIGLIVSGVPLVIAAIVLVVGIANGNGL